MTSKEIRTQFLEFFGSKGHEVVESDLLVPKGDPTLLFTSAGMNQFKDQFLGHAITYRRAASSQKCLRTADLENVGKTASHHTFFEMLGNFSFGDYFKKEAIAWGWEFMTEVLGIDEKKLWVSVYHEDDESYAIWRDEVKVPAKRIVKLGAKENFWPSNAPADGPNGPCGPCSEIFYDWGTKTGCGKKSCSPACDCGRFIEVWNLVFTQFDRRDDGSLAPLPTKNIDTGMGLERITAVMQGVKTNFETDLFVPIIEEIKKHQGGLTASDYNAIADHIRAVTFSICDGVAPSNEKRGYVIRKLIRRAFLRSRTHGPFLYNIAPKVVALMKDVYPELRRKSEEISLIVKEEEEKFAHTLSVAMPILKEDLKAAKDKVLDGEKIFRLVDTYGLPLEVIESQAKKRKVRLDTDGYEQLMEERREQSRKGTKLEEDIFTLSLFARVPTPPSSKELPLTAKIACMVKGKEALSTISEDETAELLTEPQSARFYGEAGGQVGDTGTVTSRGGSAQILNTIRIDDKTVHIIEVISGTFTQGDTVEISLDEEKKKRIARNHTATHLMHSALREVLGGHVHQAGSLVEEKRLRFDFTHMKKLTEREIEKVESIVNENIQKGIRITREEKTLDDAKAGGAIALFGEKYAADVTVITAGDASKEVCGGTHVENTKDIGTFRITSESSIGSGMRRIEAVTGDAALAWIEEQKEALEEEKRLAKKKEEEKKRKKELLKTAEQEIDETLAKARTVDGVKLIMDRVENANIGILRSLSDKIKAKAGSCLVLLGGESDGKVSLVLTVTEDLVSKGLNASALIKEMAKIVDGSGGGRADFAQAGGRDASKLDEVFAFAKKKAGAVIGGTSS